MKQLAPAALGTLLTACVLFNGDSDAPLPVEPRAAPQAPARTLVVMLGGIVDDQETLEDHRVDATIHRAWPDADVLLVGATFPYYQSGTLVPRLHEIIAPARARYDSIYLVGGSLGGAGALMYEHDHPGAVTGILLLAPWLGSTVLLDQIESAGGVARWNAGRLPQRIQGEAFDRQIWAMVKGWQSRPHLARRVWVACGSSDRRMLDGARLLAAELPHGHYLERPGGHKWAFWDAVGPELLQRVGAERQVLARGGNRTNGRSTSSE